MRIPANCQRPWQILLLLSVASLVGGCSRTSYRLDADREVYEAIAERNIDPRWNTGDISIEIDPRSRYFDPYDPDRPPMPEDDPLSHEYMRLVDGKKGWKHWDDNGYREDLENPRWQEALREYMALAEDGSVKLDVEAALKLAYVHSPLNQRQLESLYLSALDVTAERFRLSSQFFAGYDARFAHNGNMIPAGLSYDSASGGYIVTSPVRVEGLENNRLTVGRPSAGNPAFQVTRRFATAGQLLAGFANSFVFEFTGNDANFTSSLANFTFLQPLLAGAGRDIALESLTFAERRLLANLRAYGQFRQGFYTRVAVGDLGVVTPSRGGANTLINVFLGGGGVNGYLGLLQQLQQIRNSEDNLNLQLRTLTQLEALLEVGVIDLVQVDQFRQSVETERTLLLQARNSLALSLDRYKTATLGLPPDLPVQLDDGLIRQFQLVTPEATAVTDNITTLQDRVGKLPDDASLEAIRKLMIDIAGAIEPVGRQLDEVQKDLVRADGTAAEREQSMDAEARKQFRKDIELLRTTLAELDKKFRAATADLKTFQDGLTEQTRADTATKLVVWLGNFLRLAQRSVLVQARARLESVTVETLELDSEEAFRIALENRLDFKNGRAALVDRWRLIQINANALQSRLNVTSSGDLRTARNNPLSFRAPTGSLRLGLEFDAPLTRLLERNDYRESLIEYQRGRRDFIQSRDSLHLGVRELLRQITLLRTNLEIQRRAVAIAIRRVDSTRAELYAPVPPPQPGQRAAQFGPTAARNLLTSLTSLRTSQNAFLRVWLSYYAARMRLARELGIMRLDSEGRWIETPPPAGEMEPVDPGNATRLPPPVPDLLPAPPFPDSAGPTIPAMPDPKAWRQFETQRLPRPADAEGS